MLQTPPRIRNKLAYRERISTLSHNANVYAFSVILVAQFIFLNFHKEIGASLTVVAIFSLTGQIIISSVEYYYLSHDDKPHLDRTLFAHFVFNHIINAVFIPFFLWAVVLMYESGLSGGTTGAPTL
jgi:hypothetical protein